MFWNSPAFKFQCFHHFLLFLKVVYPPWKEQFAPEIGPHPKNGRVVFQLPFFRGYVSFRVGTSLLLLRFRICCKQLFSESQNWWISYGSGRVKLFFSKNWRVTGVQWWKEVHYQDLISSQFLVIRTLNLNRPSKWRFLGQVLTAVMKVLWICIDLQSLFHFLEIHFLMKCFLWDSLSTFAGR